MAGRPGNTPDSPGHGENEDKSTWPRERSTFSIEEGNAEDVDTGQGYEAPDQTVFDLTMDYSDDETLLDWEQYAGQRKFYFLGVDCSLVARFCPFMPCVPKEWYHRYSKTQRKWMAIGASSFCGLLVLLIGATVLLNLLPQQNVAGGLQECSWDNYHLPASFKPSQYNLALDVDLQPPYPVKGSVEILMNVTKQSKCIVLHATDMDISNVKRQDTGAEGTWKANEQDQIILEFEQAITGPSLIVSMDFSYTLKQGLNGFYMSNYTDGSGNSQVMATTQMEANNARKAFPCFDEPALKAKWNVSIAADSDQTVLFNMPVNVMRNMTNGKSVHAFQPTPPMSSYLVAFIVGKMESVSRSVPYPEGKGNERQISIWGTPGRESSLRIALEVATKVLPAYEQLFGVPYPLPKLDFAAIPDFAAGAMENWGLITFRETDLLLAANDSSVQNERRVALVIAHEMAHLWFGDLVTLGTWGELWLNEGFATYFENIGASVARPNMAYLETFFSGLATTALARDALTKSTHPLATLTDLDTAEKVESSFDGIAYDKGGSVLRMLRAYLTRNMEQKPLLRRSLQQAGTEDLFMASLQNYLRKYQYNTSSSKSLWQEFDGETGEDVSGWMNSWTFQSGFPKVTILREGDALKIYQKPFDLGPDPRSCVNTKKPGQAPWWIPIAKSTRDERSASWSTLSTCVMNEPLYTLKDGDDWVKLNFGQYGLYRVDYPAKIWENLAKAAATQESGQSAPTIPAEDLAGLLDDSWALSKINKAYIIHFLDLLKALSQRQLAEYAPWSVASLHLVGIRSYLEQFNDPGCTEKWSNFVRNNITTPFMANKPYLSLDFNNSGGAQPDVQARLLRVLLAGVAAEFNVSTGMSEALTLFTGASGSYGSIDTDIRGNIYAYAAASNQQEIYNAVKAIYLNTNEPNERERALGALAYAESSDLTAQTLEFALSSDVRSQDTTALIARISFRGASSLDAAWKFVQTRYLDIAKKLGGEKEAGNAMGKLIGGIASGFANEKAIQELHAIFEENKKYLTEPRLRDLAEESIRANMDWLAKNAKPVCDWLNR